MKIGLIIDVVHPLLEKIKEKLSQFDVQTRFIHWSEITYSCRDKRFMDFDLFYLDRMAEDVRCYSTQLSLLSLSPIFKDLVINDPQSYWIARDKALSSVSFVNGDLPIPETFVLFSESQIKDVLYKHSHWVLKSALGTCAQEVIPFSKDDYPKEKIASLLLRDGLMILQEFIFNPKRFIWRIDIVDQLIIVANKRYAFTDHKLALCNGSHGGKVEFFDPVQVPKKVTSLALEAMKHLNLSIGGVDLIEDERGNIYLLEVNPEPDITLDRYEFPYAIADFLYKKSSEKK